MQELTPDNYNKTFKFELTSTFDNKLHLGDDLTYSDNENYSYYDE